MPSHRPVRRRSVAAVALAAGLAALAPAVAHADSIVYEQGGDVWLAAPDGSRTVRVTTTGGYTRPTQADDGTIVAIKDKLLQRLDRSGRVLNTAGASDYTGPLSTSIAPGGRYVAYSYFATGPITSGFHAAFSYADRPTVNYEIQTPIGDELNPAFIDDSRALVFPTGLITDVQIWSVTGGLTDWFDDTSTSNLGGGETDRALTRLAATTDGGGTIRLYRLNAPPPAPPEPRCTISGPVGTYFHPSWSPDGRSLAWQEDDGIHIGTIDLETCGGSERLVIPGGKAPDWGPADLPAVASGPGPAPPNGGGTPGPDSTPPRALTTFPARIAPAALLRGLPVRVTCNEACRVTLTLRTPGRRPRTVGTGTASLTAGRRATVRVRVVRRALLQARATGVRRLVLQVRSVDAAGNAARPVLRTLTLTGR